MHKLKANIVYVLVRAHSVVIWIMLLSLILTKVLKPKFHFYSLKLRLTKAYYWKTEKKKKAAYPVLGDHTINGKKVG